MEPSITHTGSETPAAGRHQKNWSCLTRSVEETHALGSLLGQFAAAGTVLALTGQLGARKTHLTQGIALGLGIDRKLVNSPTFALIQEYAGRLPVFHFDTYRLRSTDEFLELGFDEYLAAQGVCIIEWANRVREVLPRDCLNITLTVETETIRRLEFQAAGPVSSVLLAAIMERKIDDGHSVT